MLINLEYFAPVAEINTNNETITNILTFIKSIVNTYNLPGNKYGCFYPKWETVKPVSVIGRAQMLDFIRQLNSNDVSNTFIELVQIYTKI